jgi:hypothetical protein
MHENDYRALIRDKFFIRPNEEEDSAGVINTTEVYFTKPSPKE